MSVVATYGIAATGNQFSATVPGTDLEVEASCGDSAESTINFSTDSRSAIILHGVADTSTTGAGTAAFYTGSGTILLGQGHQVVGYSTDNGAVGLTTSNTGDSAFVQFSLTILYQGQLISMNGFLYSNDTGDDETAGECEAALQAIPSS